MDFRKQRKPLSNRKTLRFPYFYTFIYFFSWFAKYESAYKRTIQMYIGATNKKCKKLNVSTTFRVINAISFLKLISTTKTFCRLIILINSFSLSIVRFFFLFFLAQPFLLSKTTRV